MSDSKKFSKILVGIDGSKESMDATDYAISLAKIYGSEIIAIHVILSDVSLFGPMAPSHLEEMKLESQEYLDKVVQKATESNKDIPIKTEIIASASVVGGLLDFAEKENIDLIVIGTKGRSGIKKLLLGSVASGIVTHSHCPVMVVK